MRNRNIYIWGNPASAPRVGNRIRNKFGIHLFMPIPAKIILQPIEALANFVYSVRLTFAHRSNYVVNNLVWLIKFASC